MPKLSEAATKKDKKDAKGGGGLGFGLFRLGSRAGKTPKGQEKPIIPRDGATPGNSSRDGGGGGAAAIPKRFKTGAPRTQSNPKRRETVGRCDEAGGGVATRWRVG